jgi:hypothetical protein
METLNRVRFSIRDNGGRSFDRYTIVFPGIDSRMTRFGKVHFALASSEHPFHPQGFGQTIECSCGKHLGKSVRLNQLPEDVQKFVRQTVGMINNQLVLEI